MSRTAAGGQVDGDGVTNSGARLNDWFPTTKYIMEIRYTTNVPGSQRLRGQDGKPEQDWNAEPYIQNRVEHTNKYKCGAEGNGMP